MNYLSIEKISKTYGLKTLFEDISFGIDKGNKVGLVAKNGTGKSTLLKIIAGKETPDTGEVVLRNGITVAFLDQSDSFNKDQTIKSFLYDNPKFECINRYEELLESDPGGEAFQKAMEDMTRLNAWDTEQQIHKVLKALGVKDINKNMTNLSGGEIKRIALSKVLLDEADLIILDEPTNHLDLDMIEWLDDSENDGVFSDYESAKNDKHLHGDNVVRLGGILAYGGKFDRYKSVKKRDDERYY